MRLNRLQTTADQGPYEGLNWRVHKGEDWIEYTVPASWGAAAAELLIEKVFYKGALPALTRPVAEEGVPAWLCRREADSDLDGISAESRYRYERDFRDVLARVAGGLCYQAWQAGLFDGEDDAAVFFDECRRLIATQMMMPEPQLLAVAGLDWAYGLQASYVPAANIAGFAEDMPVSAGVAAMVAEDDARADILKRISILGARFALDNAKASVVLPVENLNSPGFAEQKLRSDVDDISRALGAMTLRQALHGVMDACDRGNRRGFDPVYNRELYLAMEAARAAGVAEAAIRMAVSRAEQGFEDIDLPRTQEDLSPAPLAAVLSLPDEFIERALTGHGYLLGGQRHYPADKLWDKITAAIWASGEPGLFFRNSATGFAGMQGPALETGYVFLPDTAAPGAVINLPAFQKGDSVVDAALLSHAVRITCVALEAAFDIATVPAKAKAYRPLNIGMTGFAALLMGAALPYDSDAGRATAGLVAGLVSAAAQQASADIAGSVGAYDMYRLLEKDHLQAVKDKITALNGAAAMHKGMTRRPVQMKAGLCPDGALVTAVRDGWDAAYAAGREHGYRHAHLTAVGTSLETQHLLGAQTRDIAPEASLVRFEGYYGDISRDAMYGKKINPMAARALKKLGYGVQQEEDIHFYAAGHGTLLDAPAINHASLRQKGFHQAALDALEAALHSAQHIRYAFNKWTLGADFCRHMLGFTAEAIEDANFDMLTALGFSEDDIDAANLYCCGAMTLQGAPHLKEQHLPVFDCMPGAFSVRSVTPQAQLLMQAGIEAFLSGAVAHTVELPHHAGIEDVAKLSLQAWEYGVKSFRLYRDGCSLLYPVFAPPQKAAPREVPAMPELLRALP
jgi:ribonucleoside-diphosphate reductase alpha chain